MYSFPSHLPPNARFTRHEQSEWSVCNRLLGRAQRGRLHTGEPSEWSVCNRLLGRAQRGRLHTGEPRIGTDKR